MKQHEVIYQGQGTKLVRDGQAAIIGVGDETVTLGPAELQCFLDALNHLERRVMSYVESQAIEKVMSE